MLNRIIYSHIFAAGTAQVTVRRVVQSWPWYIIRAAGFTAAALLILLMLTGIGKVTGIIYKYIEPVKVWAIHKALAIALLVAIAMHIGFLLIDKYVRFNLIQILFPFASHYNNGTKLLGLPFGGLAITMGVLSMYLIIIIVASSLGWIESKKGLWRTIHYFSYLVIFLIMLHAIYAGSDLKYGMFRSVWILVGFIMAIAIAIRLWRIGTLKKGKK